jgi:hypothetical protein
MASADGQPASLSRLLAQFSEQIDGETEVHVDDIFGAFGSRAFGPLILIPAVLAITPLGAVPGVPSIVGLTIALIAGQHALGRTRPWMPKRIMNRSVAADKVRSGIDRGRPWARRIDALIRPRLTRLLRRPLPRILAALTTLIALAMIPLEVIPFAAAAPAIAIAFFGLALIAHDGLMLIIGGVLAVAAALLPVFVL